MKIISYWTQSLVFNGDTPFGTHSHSDSSPLSEVATTWQTDSAAHKLKPRSFHKSAHLWVHSVNFHPSVNHTWQVIVLVISLEFAKKQGFKLKKIENLIYIRNVNRTFNRKRPIENIVELNIYIYYQRHRERTEIDVIEGQKWNVILKML